MAARSIGKKTKNLTINALLTAIVILFQLLGLIPQISATKMSFVLIPIVLGSIGCGIGSGLWLGFIFGLIVFLGGLFGIDAFTASLIQINPWFTMIICFGKGMLAGLVPGLIYKALHRFNFHLAAILASIAAPVVNTGLFCTLMFFLFRGYFGDQIASDASFFVGFGFIFLMILTNFIIELLTNAIIGPVLAVVIRKSRKIPLLKD